MPKVSDYMIYITWSDLGDLVYSRIMYAVWTEMLILKERNGRGNGDEASIDSGIFLYGAKFFFHEKF